MKLQRELQLDEQALSNLQADRRRFLCKAVDNYVHCLAEGEQHDDWVFRLASLWLENADLREVNATMKVGGAGQRRHARTHTNTHTRYFTFSIYTFYIACTLT